MALVQSIDCADGNLTLAETLNRKDAGMSNETRVLELRAKISELELAEEGAKEAFGHVVQQKRDLEAECKRLRGRLDDAYASIRRMSHVTN